MLSTFSLKFSHFSSLLVLYNQACCFVSRPPICRRIPTQVSKLELAHFHRNDSFIVNKSNTAELRSQALEQLSKNFSKLHRNFKQHYERGILVHRGTQFQARLVTSKQKTQSKRVCKFRVQR